MIRFCNWKINCDGPLLAMQYDNLTRELRVEGNLPDGYDWAALVQVNRYFDIIALERTAGGAAAVLTAEQLSQSGYYTVQLRGTRGSKVRHTNTIRVAVGRSLSGDENWPEIPSEFTQIEQRVYEAMHSAASSEEMAFAARDSARMFANNAESMANDAAGQAKVAESFKEMAENAALRADRSWSDADTAAKNAASSKTAAANSAAEAKASAAAAKASAEAAAVSETNALKASEDAKTSEQHAYFSADEARQAAFNVTEAVREITLHVDAAAASAASAAQNKTAAETAAQNAEASAEDAAASAKRAEDAAANAGGGIAPGEIAGGVEAIVTLAECGVITPAYENKTFYTDGNGFIYIL